MRNKTLRVVKKIIENTTSDGNMHHKINLRHKKNIYN